MRLARLFDGVDAAGKPFFAADRARIADPVERARVADFLRSGKVIRRVNGLDVDRIDASRGKAVPRSTLTDGVWIWNAGLRYYVETHGIAPEEDFLEHIGNSGYCAQPPDERAWLEALDVLRASQRRP
jgi:hypothetical protein